jgi:hypothetical protein
MRNSKNKFDWTLFKYSHKDSILPSFMFRILLFLPLAALLIACGDRANDSNTLLDALTFHASFNNGPDADFAKGDPTMYTLVARNPERIEDGLPSEARLIPGGRFGDHITFNTPEGVSGTRAFFKLPHNFEHQKSDWAGTISFWIKVSPDEDLRPGYTDPIQLTPRSALDGCLWVDFSLDAHRVFRMGAFPDKEYWNPENKPNKEIADTERPLIPLVDPPFSRDHWSHVVMTIQGFNNPGKNGVAKLYIDGKLHDTLTGWEQIYTWNLDEAQIRLGVNYIGALDEISCFNRELTAAEIRRLFELEEGITALLK